MRNASGHQCKVKMSGSEKKSEREHVRHFLQGSFWKFLVVVVLIRPIVVFHRSPALPSRLA